MKYGTSKALQVLKYCKNLQSQFTITIHSQNLQLQFTVRIYNQNYQSQFTVTIYSQILQSELTVTIYSFTVRIYYPKLHCLLRKKLTLFSVPTTYLF